MTQTLHSEPFGRLPDGRPVHRFVLRQPAAEVRILDYGAVVSSLLVPDRDGRLADVVLGFDSLAGYLGRQPYLGAAIGRNANRIAGARFLLDGILVRLEPNEGEHQLHGGPVGFDRRLWKATPGGPGGDPSLELALTSPAGEGGYPGTLQVRLRFSLSAEPALRIETRATTDAPTLVNPTHHGYFQLSGAGRGDVLAHELWIDAERYTPVGSDLIPTGELRPVEATPFDFRSPRAIGARLADADPQLRTVGGYDHNFVLNGSGLRVVARVRDPATGRRLVLSTDRPGLQLFTANGFSGRLRGKGGAAYGPRSGLCLEPQAFPDAPNQPGFPSTVLRPGETFQSTTIYRFATD
ncbi:MAG: galactose-1-epimerase [Deltaproteobacteria bacterium]|nr:galactose-1-epimerase [Deltaproteobacteria bacterium]